MLTAAVTAIFSVAVTLFTSWLSAQSNERQDQRELAMAFLEELHAYDAPLEHCHSLLPGFLYAQPPPATEWPSGVRLRQIRSRLEVSAPELVSRYAEIAESSHVDAAWDCAQAEAKHERGEPLGKQAGYAEESYEYALHTQAEFAEIARIVLYDTAWDRLFPEEGATP